MNNLELSQQLGFAFDIVGTKWRTGVEMHGYQYFQVIAIDLTKKREPIRTANMEGKADARGCHQNFLKKQCVQVID